MFLNSLIKMDISCQDQPSFRATAQHTEQREKYNVLPIRCFRRWKASTEKKSTCCSLDIVKIWHEL